ncbi:MAG: GumC family protein, partial [Terriglobales bacterium]
MAYISYPSGESNSNPSPLYELEPAAASAPRRHRFQNALYRQRWLAIAILIACVIAAGVLSYAIRPYYQATSALIIRHPNLHAAQITPQEYTQPIDPDREMQTELTILGSRTVAMPVIHQLHLEQRDPAIATVLAKVRRNMASKGKKLDLADADAIAYGVFSHKLTAVPDKLSATVHVSYQSHNPDLAAAVVNATDQSFLAETLATRGMQGQTAAHWMRLQVNDAIAQLHRDDGAVTAFQQTHAYVPLLAASGAQSALLARLADANHAYSSSETERIADAAALASYTGSVVASLPAGLSNPEVENAVESLGAAQKQLSALETTYQPTFPLVVEAKQQRDAAQQKLANLKTQVVTGLRQRLADSQQREDQLQALVTHLNHRAASTSGLEMHFAVLQSRANAQRALVATLQQKLNEVKLEASLPPSNIQVLDPALPPGGALYPNLRLDLALGLGLGLVFGVGAALAREHWSGALTASDEVQHVLGPALAPLGMVAEARMRRSLRSGTRALLGAGDSRAGGEGYSKVAANLVARCGIPPRTILVTSASEGEGKTTSVCELGCALAQAGWRTLLVDADLLRPGCHSYFGVANLHGLAAAQTGRK